MAHVNRSRTVSWADPLEIVRASADLSGLEIIRGFIEGRFPPPPIVSLLGFRIVEADEGRAVFEVEPHESHYNGIGVVHGGIAATLLDSAMGCAVQSTQPRGRTFTTLELKTNYVRALTVGSGVIRCEAKVLHVGSRVATAEGRVTDPKGRLCAHGSTTCLVYDISKKG